MSDLGKVEGQPPFYIRQRLDFVQRKTISSSCDALLSAIVCTQSQSACSFDRIDIPAVLSLSLPLD